MKVTPDDPRLSAYLLGELSHDEAAVIKRAAAADPAIKMSLSELEKTLGFFSGVFGGAGDEKLLPAQREAIRQAGRDAESLSKVVPLASAHRSWKPWLTGFGAAAAVAFAAVLMSRVEPERSSGIVDAGAVTDEIALLPMPGPTAGEGATSVGNRSGSMVEQAKNLESRPGGFLSDVAKHLDRKPLPESSSLPMTGPQSGFASGPMTRLPVIIGSSSFHWVNGWIREKQQLPPKNAVRVEEMINSAVLPGGVESGDLLVAIEVMKCPWNTDSLLVGVQLKAGSSDTKDLKVIYRSQASRRILGSFSVRNDGALPSVLPANHRTLSILEVKDDGSGLGGVSINHGTEKLELRVPSAGETVSPGMRHAAGLAGFGMWLRNEGVKADQVRSMLVDAVSDTDSVRAETRRMIEEALKLADSER